MKTNPFDLVFPTEATNSYEPGLTKREYFAALALQGLLAAGRDHNSGQAGISEKAVLLSDSLINQLNKS